MTHAAKIMGIGLVLAALLAAGCAAERTVPPPPASPMSDSVTLIALPTPRPQGRLSLEETLAQRRSVREYTPRLLTREETGQLLWAAQGITSERGFRTAPSAGALYPLEVYLVLPEGVYHYLPEEHQLNLVKGGDVRPALRDAAVGQEPVSDAPAVFVIAGVYARTAAKYGDRAERYVHLEAGHAAQNLLLQAVSLGLGGVSIGAFYDEPVRDIVGMGADETPLYLIPVGEPAGR